MRRAERRGAEFLAALCAAAASEEAGRSGARFVVSTFPIRSVRDEFYE